MKQIAIIIGLLFSIITVSATLSNIEFNGNWVEGSTIYSDNLHIQNSYLYGNDVYPIREANQNVRQKICETYTKTKFKLDCNYVVNKGKKCIRVPYEVEYEKCKYITTNKVQIGCLNANGIYTNQLQLSNFEYTRNGVDWLKIPYYNDKLYLENEDVQFRLNIPSNCSPVYYYNKSIFIKK